MPVAARPKVSVCRLSLAGIAGSNPAGGMDVYVLWSCVVKYRSLRQVDHSSRGVIQRLVRLGMIEELQCGGLDPLGLSNHYRKLYPLLSVIIYSIFIGIYQRCWYHGSLRLS